MKANKRKDIMSNIKRRLELETYSVSNIMRNQKDVLDKIKHYERKEAAGDLKAYMRPRYEEAKELMARLEERKIQPPTNAFRESLSSHKPASPLGHVPGKNGWMYGIGDGYGLSPVLIPSKKRKTLKLKPSSKHIVLSQPPALSPIAESSGPSAEVAPSAALEPLMASLSLAPPPSPKPMTLKKRMYKSRKLGPSGPSGPSGLSEFISPRKNSPPIQAPVGYYNENGEFRETGRVPVGEPSNQGIGSVNEVMQRYGLTRSRKAKKQVAFKSRWPTIAEENMPYLEEASKKFLPLPQLYNPFTGEAYMPEEDPQPDIARAYDMLHDIMKKAIAKAKTLKKRKLQKEKVY
jgi:hypothetical protein